MKPNSINNKKKRHLPFNGEHWPEIASSTYFGGIATGQCMAEGFIKQLRQGKQIVPKLGQLVIDLTNQHSELPGRRGEIVGFFSLIEEALRKK